MLSRRPDLHAAAPGTTTGRHLPDDASVVAAHPDLPGLAWLLQGHTGDPRYAVDRLRLKPGTSVTASLRPDAPGVPWLLVQAYAPGPWSDKRAKTLTRARRTGHRATTVPEARVVVVPAAADRRLRPLSSLRPDSDERVRLGGIRGVATTLSYNPSRRWVGRVTGDDRTVLVRIHAAGHTGPQKATTTVHPWRPGVPWRAGDPLPDLPAVVADAVEAAGGVPPRPWDIRTALVSAAEGLRAVHAPWGHLAHDLAIRAADRLAELPVRPAHGDLSTDQLVVDGGTVHVLDWDRVGLWPRGWDAASWTVSALMLGGDPSACAAEVSTLGLDAPDPVVLAAAALLRAPEPFRRRLDGWPERTHDLLVHAAGWLS